MPRIRAAAVAFTAAALTVTTLAAATQASAAGVNYAALGDSYSAGVGSGSYTSDSGSCSRSTKAYPYLWKTAHAPSSFAFVACSGAKTGDVAANQLGVLNSSTTLVSITIGGNDAGFASTMQTCVLDSESSCLSAVNAAKSYATNTLPGQLAGLYGQIRAKAPNAKVVVLGYPHLYQVPGTCVFGISNTKRTAINGAADTLDTVIAKQAANAGFTFQDVRTAFSGHEICGSSSQWLNSTTLPISDSYHPNASGQASGYLPLFSAAA
ncbi:MULTISPECIES: SGNH/GDSL hydrolase family protein [Kitasatospora]|uniref:Putative lipase n=1 Tax=Kitasatospora setae (strain ATCC 33774 / DSM 43861 / JCM 3304 / KCC A-0304 / NBRC 14216 / KM-6054) TaxID=452652 RepID=E4N1K6_KITSK|nr:MULTISPECIES: SGNH/GDSL hydrolase family protein [Kitasatospora]BAJ32040.1 putative lipase [Kitasatospora setae KM-6054]